MSVLAKNSGTKVEVVITRGRRSLHYRGWYLLLALPYLALLYPPVYSHYEPTFLGFPFFYWYQFLWVILSALLTGIVYLALRRR